MTLKKVDIAGKPHILAFSRDITERQSAESRRCARARSSTARSSTPRADSLVLRDADFRIVDVNPAYEAMSGRRARGGARRAARSPEPARAERARARRCTRARSPASRWCSRRRRARKDGTRFDIETRGVPIQHRGQPHVLYIGRDITRAQDARSELLRASEEQYRAIFNASADALVLRDAELPRRRRQPRLRRDQRLHAARR